MREIYVYFSKGLMCIQLSVFGMLFKSYRYFNFGNEVVINKSWLIYYFNIGYIIWI